MTNYDQQVTCKTPTLHCTQQKIYLESQFECNGAHTQTYRDHCSKYRDTGYSTTQPFCVMRSTLDMNHSHVECWTTIKGPAPFHKRGGDFEKFCEWLLICSKLVSAVNFLFCKLDPSCCVPSPNKDQRTIIFSPFEPQSRISKSSSRHQFSSNMDILECLLRFLLSFRPQISS